MNAITIYDNTPCPACHHPSWSITTKFHGNPFATRHTGHATCINCGHVESRTRNKQCRIYNTVTRLLNRLSRFITVPANETDQQPDPAPAD